jgi:hypothetical protein
MNEDPELNELLGLFDAPAFARRGLELEYAINRLHERCQRERSSRCEMIRVRLRQWAGAATGSDCWTEVFRTPIDELWSFCGAEAPSWSERLAPLRRRREIGHDLVASVIRFNTRWERYLDQLKLDLVNRAIDDFNRYYTLEKECVVGSARLAAQHFVPRARITRDSLLAVYGILAVPELVG